MRAEKGIEKAVEAFMKYQMEAEERHKKYEDERWEKEVELEEKWREDNQQHERKMMGMLASMLQSSPQNYPRPGLYNYNDEDFQADYTLWTMAFLSSSAYYQHIVIT